MFYYFHKASKKCTLQYMTQRDIMRNRSMKTSIFKRSIAGMLAFAFLLTTMLSVGGTTAFAAGTLTR